MSAGYRDLEVRVDGAVLHIGFVLENRGRERWTSAQKLSLGWQLYDPDSSELLGWRLEKRRYVPLEADAHGRLPCEELELSLGTWEGEFVTDVGTWLRFFDRVGQVVPTPEEAANQRADAAEAEIARLRDLLGKLQAGTQNGTANHS